MMNRNEIPAAEAKIKAEIAKRGTPECKDVEALIDTYTGPATGLVWDEGAEKLELAEGYIFDNDGNVVLLDDVTGPGTGMIYKDGKLVPAE
ncbi:MAG TPA: hypothetical protein IAA51_02685 [Candidatus Cottocaccamicrobium excrementipullorum]|nr:hypothetical protein [Candidatus Cottocaccamicrobium excrementipullorum]